MKKHKIDEEMPKEIDFSKAYKNPWAKTLKKQITINIAEETIEYFKALAVETGIPYQSLINLYLTNCAKKKIKPDFDWK